MSVSRLTNLLFSSLLVTLASCTSAKKANPDPDLELVTEVIANAANGTDPWRIRLCLEGDSDPNAVVDVGGWYNTTALTESAERRSEVQVIQLLLQHGANPNVQVKKGWSPLMLAAANGHTETALLLIESGADVTASREQNINSKLQPGFDSALSHAMARGDLVLVKALIEAGAYPLQVQDITEAWSEGRDDVVQMIFSIPEDPLKNPEVMREAAKNILWYGKPTFQLKKLLLEKWIDLDTPVNSGARQPIGSVPPRITALSIAAQSEETSLLQDLLARGVTIDLQPKDYFWISNPENVKLLRNAAPDYDLNGQDALGRTPLYYVNNTKVAKQLIEYGARIDIADNSGDSSLDIALIRGNVDLVKLYLEFSGELESSMPNVEAELFRQAIQIGNMPVPRLQQLLKIAVALDRPDLINVPEMSGVRNAGQPASGRLLGIAASSDAGESLRYLVGELGIDVETLVDPVNFPTTSLCAAAAGNRLNALRVLIELGAKVNPSLNNTPPPLYWAAYEGRLDVMRQLLDAGAQDQSNAALKAAVSSGKVSAVMLLIDEGAIVDDLVIVEVNRVSNRVLSKADKSRLLDSLRAHYSPTPIRNLIDQ